MSDPQVISMLYEILVAQSKYESRGLEHRSRLKANYHKLIKENSAHKDLNRKFPKQQLNKMVVSLADSVRILDATELQPTDLELCYGINQYVFPKIPDFNSLDSKYLSKWHKFYNVLPVYHKFGGNKKRQNEKKPFPMSKRRNVRDSESSSESDASETKSPVAVLMTEDDFEDPNEDIKTEDPYEPPAQQFNQHEEELYSEFPEPDEGHVRLPIVMNKEVEFNEDSIVFGLMEDDKLNDWVSTSSFETYKQLYRQIYFYDQSLTINPAFKHEIEPTMSEEEAVKQKEKDIQRERRDEQEASSENKVDAINTNGSNNENATQNAGDSNEDNKDKEKDENKKENEGGKEKEPERLPQEVSVERERKPPRGRLAVKAEKLPPAVSKVDSSKCYRSDVRGKISIFDRKNELERLEESCLHVIEEQEPENVEIDSHTDSSEDPTDVLINTKNFYKKSKFMKLPGDFKQNTEHFDPDSIFGNYYCPISTPSNKLKEDGTDDSNASRGRPKSAKDKKKNQTTSSTTLVDSQEKADTLNSSDSNTKTELSEGAERLDSPNFMNLKSSTVNFMEVDSIYSCNELGNFEVRCSAKYSNPFASGVLKSKMEGALGVYQELQVLLKKLFALKRKISGNCSVCSGWNLLHGIAQSFCEFCEDKLVNRDPELLLKMFEIRRYIVSILYPIVGYKYQVLDLFKSGELAENWKQLLRTQKVSIQSLTQVGSSFPKASLHDSRYLPSPVTLPYTICDSINSFQFPKTNQPAQADSGAFAQHAKEEAATPINTPTKQNPFIASVGSNATHSTNSCSLRCSSGSSSREHFSAEGLGCRHASDKALQSYGLMEMVNYRRYHRAKMLNDFFEQLYKSYHARSPSQRSVHLVNNYVNILKNGHMLTTEFVVPENASLDLDSDELESSDSECADFKRKERPKQNPREASRPRELKQKELYYDEDSSFVLTRLPLDTDMIKLSFYHRGVFQSKTNTLKTYAFAQIASVFGFKESLYLPDNSASSKEEEFRRLASILSSSDATDSTSMQLETVENTQNVYERVHAGSASDGAQPPKSEPALKPELGAQTAYSPSTRQAPQLVKSEAVEDDQNSHSARMSSSSEGSDNSRLKKGSTKVKPPKGKPPKPLKSEPGKKTKKDGKAARGDAKAEHKSRGRPRLDSKPASDPKPKSKRGRKKSDAKKAAPAPDPDEDERNASDNSMDLDGQPLSALSLGNRSLDDRLLSFNYNWHEKLVRHLNKKAFLVTNDPSENLDLVSRLLNPESESEAKIQDARLVKLLHRYRLLDNMPTQVLTKLHNTGKLKIGFPTSLEMYILGVPDSIMDCSMYGGVGRGFMYSLDAIVHNLALLSTLIRIGGSVSNKRKRTAK